MRRPGLWRRVILGGLAILILTGCASLFKPGGGPRSLGVEVTKFRKVLLGLNLSTATLVGSANRLDGELGACRGLDTASAFRRLCDVARENVRTQKEHARVTTTAAKSGWDALDAADAQGSQQLDLTSLVGELEKLAPLIPLAAGALGL